MLRRHTLALGLLVTALLLTAVSADAELGASRGSVDSPALLQLPPSAAVSASDLPPGCGNHWKDPDPRTRHLKSETYMHEMSTSCVPYGPIDGSVSSGSTFIVYFSDPFEPNWCYGYSWQLARKGYVLCGALGYVDGNPDAVWRLVGDRLVPAPPTSGPKPYESCGFITYFHCEHTLVKSVALLRRSGRTTTPIRTTSAILRAPRSTRPSR